jgi:hypothetical protein
MWGGGADRRCPADAVQTGRRRHVFEGTVVVVAVQVRQRSAPEEKRAAVRAPSSRRVPLSTSTSIQLSLS